MRDQARLDVPTLVQDAYNVQHITSDSVEHEEGEAVQRPDAQRLVWQEVGIASGTDARRLVHEGQHAQQLIGKGLELRRPDLDCPRFRKTLGDLLRTRCNG